MTKYLILTAFIFSIFHFTLGAIERKAEAFFSNYHERIGLIADQSVARKVAEGNPDARPYTPNLLPIYRELESRQ